ncbi:MAG: class I SAM-dependent methyltransferase [Brumimicrobium sp.]
MLTEREEWFETWFDSPYYHILYHNRDYKEAETFISNLLNYIKVDKDSNCLDLACGKGRHSLYLNKKGLKVTGLDLSENSIQYAKSFENERLTFDVHDMREVYIESEYDIVFNLFTSFGYFEKYEDNVNVIDSIFKMLKDNGRLVLDFMNTYFVLNNLVKNETQIVQGIEFHISRKYDGQHIIKTIDFEDKGKTFHFQEKVQAIKLDDFEILLENSGFKITDTLGDSNMNPYDKRTSERLIIIAEKI